MNATIEIKNEGGGIQITTNNLPLAVYNKNGKWVAYSPVFKTLGYSSESRENAVEDFFHSLDLFFGIHLEDGTLDDALDEFSWKSELTMDTIKGPSINPTFTNWLSNPILDKLSKKSHTSNLQYA